MTRSIVISLEYAFHALAWRRFPVGRSHFEIGSLIALALLMATANVFYDWAFSGEQPEFQLYGINSVLAGSAASVAVFAIFASGSMRAVQVSALIALVGIFLCVLGLANLAWSALSNIELPPSFQFVITWAPTVCFFAYIVWAIGAFRMIFVSTEGVAVKAPLARSIGVFFALVALGFLLPLWPTFTGRDFSKTTANWYEFVSAYRANSSTDADGQKTYEDRLAEVELAQPALLQSELSKLAARDPTKENIFTLGVGGWSSQAVFAKEIAGALSVLDDRFATGERTMRLVNYFPTVWEAPVATLSNLAATLRELGARMDVDKDVLLLVLTSHGSQQGFALEGGGLVKRLMSPMILKKALDQAEIRNRIIIISACYSGVFLPDLADDNSVVITAASATTNSFGCSDKREWTYFGDAFFNQGLRQEKTLSAAFSKAQQLVAQWEKEENLTPSSPQIHIGAAIRDKLPKVIGYEIQAREGPMKQVEAR